MFVGGNVNLMEPIITTVGSNSHSKNNVNCAQYENIGSKCNTPKLF